MGHGDWDPRLDFGMEVVRGNISGISAIHKFGKAPVVDTPDNIVDVWDGCSDAIGTVTQPQYTYSTGADINALCSSNNSDTAEIEVQGLDATWGLVTQSKVLTGQAEVALVTSLVRVFRMKNIGSTALAGHVFCYEDTDGNTAGIPDTDADIRAVITQGNDQTLMALYTIPLGKTGFLTDIDFSIAQRAAGQLTYAELRIREFGGIFQVKHTLALDSDGTSSAGHRWMIPEGPLPAKTDIALRGDSDTNGGAIDGSFEVILVDD